MHGGAIYKEPAPLDVAVFAVRTGMMQARRGLTDLLERRVRRLDHIWKVEGAILSEVVMPIDCTGDDALLQNLRIAGQMLNGVVVPEGETFSFWAQIGRPTGSKGFVEGKELHGGYWLPTFSRGLCRLAHGLYRTAKQAGCGIVEHHADKTTVVFWNYLDLRFQPSETVVLNVRVNREQLIARLVSA